MSGPCGVTSDEFAVSSGQRGAGTLFNLAGLGLSIRRVDSNCRRQAEGAREEKERERGKEEEEEAQHHCIGRPYGYFPFSLSLPYMCSTSFTFHFLIY